jgi:hypothetical protein
MKTLFVKCFRIPLKTFIIISVYFKTKSTSTFYQIEKFKSFLFTVINFLLRLLLRYTTYDQAKEVALEKAKDALYLSTTDAEKLPLDQPAPKVRAMEKKLRNEKS